MIRDVVSLSKNDSLENKVFWNKFEWIVRSKQKVKNIQSLNSFDIMFRGIYKWVLVLKKLVIKENSEKQ